MLVWAYHQRVSRLKNVAEKLKIRYGKNKTISVRVKGRLDPIFLYELVGKNGWGAEDEKILSETSPEEYYKFFKSESGGNLSLYVEKVLQFGRFENSSDIQKQIAEKATQALKKIASESKLNERRVQKFGIKI